LADKRSNKKAQSGTAPEGGSRNGTVDLVIAVGASGAHPLSLERFLSDLSIDDRTAVVLIFQHREALDDERFRGG